MRLLDFPIVPRRGGSPSPSGEKVLRLPAAAWVVEFTTRPTRSVRPRVAVLDDDGWKDWPPDERAANQRPF
jgi:hypothetical protein